MKTSLGSPKPFNFRPMYTPGTLGYPIPVPVCGLLPMPMIGRYGLLTTIFNPPECYNPDGVNIKSSDDASTVHSSVLEAPGTVDSPGSQGSPCSITSSASRDSVEIEITEEDTPNSPEPASGPKDDWVVIS